MDTGQVKIFIDCKMVNSIEESDSLPQPVVLNPVIAASIVVGLVLIMLLSIYYWQYRKNGYRTYRL